MCILFIHRVYRENEKLTPFYANHLPLPPLTYILFLFARFDL